jgi:hypothetical protein
MKRFAVTLLMLLSFGLSSVSYSPGYHCHGASCDAERVEFSHDHGDHGDRSDGHEQEGRDGDAKKSETSDHSGWHAHSSDQMAYPADGIAVAMTAREGFRPARQSAMASVSGKPLPEPPSQR